jgi:pimeloyl-ACP methyl ester carboxylesterase
VPYVDRGEAKIWYTEQGTGFPMLALAPGGMRSSVPLWEMAAINPLTAYAGQYRMIAMDQRNAGQSSGVSVTRDQVRSFRTPMLVLPGVDEPHPTEIGRQIASLAPAAELLEPWKDPEHLPAATETVGRFLDDHTPR